VLPWEEGTRYIPDELKAKYQGSAPFAGQYERFSVPWIRSPTQLQAAQPDITIIISDDQDEWLFEDNMPTFAVCWADAVPIIPRQFPSTMHPGIARAITAGYGDVALEVPVASRFGRYLVEHLIDHNFDVAHIRHLKPEYGGKVARRYPTPDGELQLERETPPRPQGLPHGYSFIVKRLFNNQPRPVLPIFQNTCYPPNQPTPSVRSRSAVRSRRRRATGTSGRGWRSSPRAA
jgi:3-O-methylgallate 3,4-dioxygenase